MPTSPNFPIDDRHLGNTALRKCQLVMLRMLRIVDLICREYGISYWLDGGTLLGAVRHEGFIPWDDDIDIVMPRRDFDRFIECARSMLPEDLDIDTTADSGNERGFNVPCRIRDRYSRIVETHSADNLGLGLFVDIIPSDVYHARPPLLFLETTYKRLYSNATKVYDLSRNIRRRKQGLLGSTFNVLPLVSVARFCVRLLNRFSRTLLSYNKFQREDTGAPGYGYDVRWVRMFKRQDIYPLKRMRFEDAEFLVPHNTDGVLKVFYGANYMTPPERSKRAPKHLRALILDTRLNDVPVVIEDLE